MFERAGKPTQLRLLPGGGDVLDEAADEVYRIVHAFLAEHQARAAGGPVRVTAPRAALRPAAARCARSAP